MVFDIHSQKHFINLEWNLDAFFSALPFNNNLPSNHGHYKYTQNDAKTVNKFVLVVMFNRMNEIRTILCSCNYYFYAIFILLHSLRTIMFFFNF